ncbi:MAG TPA: DUF3040 domain-containing protein [Streptosporangiaceae bacterium]
MTLAAGEQRTLAKIEGNLRRSDPKLAAMLSTFNRLTRAEEMPRREFLAAPARLRHSGTRRLPSQGHYPSASRLTDPARYHRASRISRILPVVIAVCALGLMIVLFSAVDHGRSAAVPSGPATTCHVVLAGCRSAVPANHIP